MKESLCGAVDQRWRRVGIYQCEIISVRGTRWYKPSNDDVVDGVAFASGWMV